MSSTRRITQTSVVDRQDARLKHDGSPDVQRVRARTDGRVWGPRHAKTSNWRHCLGTSRVGGLGRLLGLSIVTVDRIGLGLGP